MDATWKEGEDYFIRLRPTNQRKVTQDDFEQKLVIQLMQLINGKTATPESSIAVRVQSYGSYEQSKRDLISEIYETYVEKYNKVRAEKWETKSNEDRIDWSDKINELAIVMKTLSKLKEEI